VSAAIQETATHIGSDNLSERIPVANVEDEISDLARLLNKMFDRLEAAFNQTRRFAAEASHELKTPLSLVRLQAEKLLVDGQLSPEQDEALQMQLEEIARLNKIIEELLFLSRAEAHAITLQLKAQDPAPFLRTFAQDARVLVEHNGVRFDDHHTGEGCVEVDPKAIRQVLFNLVANSLTFSAQGALITLGSEIRGGSWHVYVEDDGPGVPPADRERIFERFVRLERDGRPAEAGSGLGLAIARSLVVLNRGTIHAAEPPKGFGLRVSVEIPCCPPPRGGGAEIPAAVGSAPTPALKPGGQRAAANSAG